MMQINIIPRPQSMGYFTVFADQKILHLMKNPTIIHNLIIPSTSTKKQEADIKKPTFDRLSVPSRAPHVVQHAESDAVKPRPGKDSGNQSLFDLQMIYPLKATLPDRNQAVISDLFL